MRRIGIAVAILATTLYSSALAQSLRPSYSPDGTSESREASTPPTQRSIVHGSNPAPRQLAAKPRNAAAQLPRTQAKTQPKTQTQVQSQAQVQALPQIALQPQPATPNRGVHDFFAAIFAGPIMFAALRPAEPQYGMSPANAPAYAPQAYASASQADRVDYSIDPKFLRQTVAYNGSEAPGTIIVDTTNKFLYLVEGEGRALRYGIGVGRPGFLWSGIKTVTAKREWPDWTPPAEMLARRPDLPRFMPGGVDNPLGARALYLGSSLYRIHGSNEPSTIGTNVSSGCIRMRNEDVTDLYGRVKIGTKVIVI